MQTSVTGQTTAQASREFLKKLLMLAAAGGAAFWITDFVMAVSPIASAYKAAFSISSLPVALVTIGSVLVMLHIIPGFGTVQKVLNLPIFPQEMVFALWLIVKGFNPSAVASGAVKTDIN